MGQEPWKRRGIRAVKNMAEPEYLPLLTAKPDPSRQASLERLRLEIASGTYRISADSLAAKLMRRIRE